MIPKHDYPFVGSKQIVYPAGIEDQRKQSAEFASKGNLILVLHFVYGVQKVASVQNCTELVTILKTIRKQGWISFYQSILWSP